MQIKAVLLHYVAEIAVALIGLFGYGTLRVFLFVNKGTPKEQLFLLTFYHFPSEDKITDLEDQSVLGG